MKKDIIICNTYFQLIEAIQLKNTLFLHESVTVVFSDHSRNAENIIKQIKSLDIFEQCFFWSSFKKMKEQEKNSHENRRLLLCEINGKNGYGNPFESGICDELIYYNQFDNLFYLTLKLPQKKFTKKEMRQIQDEIAKRIMEELANPSYIRIYPNITTAAAFNYFSLFHALALLNIPEWKIDIPTPEQNFEYNLAYGLFKLDDRSKEFEKYGYYICNQHDWAMKHLKEELTEKK